MNTIVFIYSSSILQLNPIKKMNRVVRREKGGRASSDRKFREALHEEVTFELRLERLEGVIQANNRGKNIPG